MNSVLTASIALITGLTLSQGAFAHGGGGGGSRGGGGGGGHSAAAASGGGARSAGGGARSFGGGARSFGGSGARSFAVRGGGGSFRSAAPSYRGYGGYSGRSFSSAPGRSFSPSVVTTGSGHNQRFSTVTPRSTRAVRGNNSIAFGGRNLAQTRSARAPSDVTRGWDHGHSHDWNHHRWGWRGNDWVILDGGYGYGYPYYGYGNGYDYGYASDYPYGGGYVESAPGYGGAANGDSLAAQVQDALNQNGYDAGPADGDVGPQTRDAIAAFQQDHGLAATGRINSALLGALRID